MVAPSEYMVRPPVAPVYFFVVDVSANAVACGMLAAACTTIKACLDRCVKRVYILVYEYNRECSNRALCTTVLTFCRACGQKVACTVVKLSECQTQSLRMYVRSCKQ
jgi:Sec23/Sec24 trunk domain